MEFEHCKSNLVNLSQKLSSKENNRNEAQTRFSIIDEIFIECLRWSKDDITLEDPYEGGYTDYTFKCPRDVMIVEAKRESINFELPAGSKLITPIQTLLKTSPDIDKAIRQVAKYCQKRGVPIGVVSNGYQLIAFVAARNDSTPPLEGKALVFSSLHEMIENFTELWDCLSKPGIEEKRIFEILLDKKPIVLPEKLSAKMLNYPGIKNRNPFQTDLQVISDLVLEDIIRRSDFEESFLIDCYCKSGALSQYSSLSKEILKSRYDHILKEMDPTRTFTPALSRKENIDDFLQKGITRRPILLVGDVGVGKSMFIRNLIKVDAKDFFDKATYFYIDLGAKGSLTKDLREFILNEIQKQLLAQDFDIFADDIIRRIYKLDLKRFESGLYKAYKETNPALYAQKEIEYLEKHVSQLDEHLKKVFLHISKSHKKEIVIFIDNTDQRSEETQEKAFLICQELSAEWSATSFLTIRPETFKRSIESGALSGYHPKAFYIAPPRVDNVIEKRLKYAIKIASGEVQLADFKDSSFSFSSFKTLATIFLDSIQNNRDLVLCIDDVSRGNIRRALDFIKGFFGSGHINTQKIIDIYNISGCYFIPLHEFLRALIFGDTIYYSPNSSPISNIFDIKTLDEKEYFLTLNILRYLHSKMSLEDGFVDMAEFYNEIQSLGYAPDQIDYTLISAVKKGLVETPTRRIPNVTANKPLSIRITSLGAYISCELVQMFPYIDSIIVDVPILDKTKRLEITKAITIQERLNRAMLFVEYLDHVWNSHFEKKGAFFDWTSISAKLKSNIKSIEDKITASISNELPLELNMD